MRAVILSLAQAMGRHVGSQYVYILFRMRITE